ncbi:HNH endonuclease signature motif containing protein, partial [Occultella kanbiaonis]|uniref:HNH endonuclease signature motif containing protein n=1 Tax=Occultella kanbiaonis TaxID=2675754 RepID=UPI0013D14C8F
MVDELTRADLAGMDEYELVDALGCFRRLEAVGSAGVREVAAELASRASMVMPRPRAVGRRVVFRESLAADEIAAKVGCSKQEANRLVRVGQFLGGIAAPTGEALARGEIDAGKADVIAVAVSVLEAEAAFKVQDELLPKAVLWTRHRVVREVAKMVAAADPAQFTQRAAQASTRRYVGRARVDVDGMASQTVYWPAADALGLDLLLDSAASSAKAAGDLRTLEQLRADVMADIVAHGLNTGQVGDLTGFTFQLRTGPCTHNHDHDHEAEQDAQGSETETSTASPTTEPEASNAPSAAPAGVLEGTCAPTTAPTGVPEGTGAPTTGQTGGPEGTGAPATGSGAPVAPGAGFLGSWHGADTGADPRAFTPARGQGLPRVWPLGVLGGHRAQILIRVTLTTLMGGDDPGDIEGLGPIPADVARAFAAGGTWRRLVTDPITDRVLDYGTTRYQPPQNMSDRIKENEPHCTAPGCSATARMTELDHRTPFPLGHTSDDNLDPKCRRCHVLKTHGNFEDEVDEHGNRFWRTPTGHVYMRTPNGTITELPRTRPDS